MSGGISRRRLLGLTGAGAAVAGVGAVSGYALGRPDAPVAAPGQDIVAFRGTHQAGIVTPSQNELYFTALDLTSTGKATVQRMLSQWTTAAERLTRGLETAENGALPLNPEAPPADTGEALDLPPSSLTVTIGFGCDVLRQARHRRPAPGRAGRPARRSQGDRLDPARSRRRHLHPGLRERPAGRGARRAQPRPHRLRDDGGALGAARVRPDVVDVDPADHGPQPVRLQGRHEQPQGRGTGPARRARVGAERRRAGLDDRRDLPRRPPHPDAHRDLGPLLAHRAGVDHRADQGHRRPAGRDRGVRARQLPVDRRERHARHPARPRTSGSRRPSR